MDDSMSVESITLEAMVAGYAALGDPIRLQVLGLLESGARCVCELQEEVGVAPNLLSYHLKVLREAGLIAGSRRGRWIDYRLLPDAVEALRTALPEAR